MTYRISASARIAGDPDAVFAQITDPRRLPEWNRAVTEVTEVPEGPLQSGSVWEVKIHAMGRSWISRSEARVVDKAGGRFTYRSQSADGNPSFADWAWQLEPVSGGTRVTTSVELEPRTFWRQHLLVHVRRPALRREMRVSLFALEQALVEMSR